MRTIRTKVYQFSELSKAAKVKAIEWYVSGNDLYWVWNDLKEDAKSIGLKIISLDDNRANEGQFLLSACEVVANIFRDHGENCETYKTATKFIEEWQPVFGNYMDENHEDYESSESEATLLELEDEFLKSLLEDYRIMYNNDIDYQNTDEAAIEAITANEYEFKADGSRF